LARLARVAVFECRRQSGRIAAGSVDVVRALAGDELDPGRAALARPLLGSASSDEEARHERGKGKDDTMRKLILFGSLCLSGVAMSVGCEDIPSAPSKGTGQGADTAAEVQTTPRVAALEEKLACGGDQSSINLYVPPPLPAAVAQVEALARAHRFREAARLTAMLATPQATWFTQGTPDEVDAAVQATMARARHEHRVPVLVAYNLPFRDCSQYSAGGALDTATYDAWIDGFASGIGDGEAIVILEPDGLGLIPYNTTLDGQAESCKPTVTDASGATVPAPGASPAERYAQLNHAVDSLAGNAPKASVYLDGTHSSWLGSGEAAYRLVNAGVQRAKGLFVNVSNFQPTPELTKYATWISKCIYFAHNTAEGGWRLGHYDYCGSQYYPATPTDFSTWGLTDQWYADNVDNAANPPSGPEALAHFVIDTSRNGQGPFSAAGFAAAPFDQPATVIAGLNAGNWCNPPTAGLGPRPTTATGAPLADAYLWVKLPGGSDGSCDIAGGARAWDYSVYNPWGVTGDAQDHFDPLWGLVDPAAGAWFPEQALALAKNAAPPLLPLLP
jgi:endoglucanase